MSADRQPSPAPADLVVTGGPIYTGRPDQPWIEAFAVTDGNITHTGRLADIRRLTGDRTQLVDLGGRMAMPGLIDGHLHLGLGGTQLAWEVPLLPEDGPEEIFAKVRSWAEQLAPGEWVIGGIIGSGTYGALNSVEMLRRLDDAAMGHPVLLRDDTMHNRQVNSVALAAMGVGVQTPDPEGGTYARDAEGRLTGALWELAGTVAEEVAAASHADPHGRLVAAMRTALGRLRQVGCTAVQDAATMAHHFAALRELEQAGELSAWVVCSMPARDFIESGTVGEELFATGSAHRTELVRPDFVKFVLDGVPTTRTTAFLQPYRCRHSGEDPSYAGEPYWSLEDLVAGLHRCHELGLGAKMHATGDASVRLALDAAEVARREIGADMVIQVAHMSFIAPEDVPRFAALEVYADACPFMWHPSPLVDGVAAFVPEEVMARIWPFKDLLGSGALVAGGSDWPVGLPELNPWLGIETMVTRSSTGDDPHPRSVNPDQAITLEQAVAAFTRDSAVALGIADRTGTLRPGLSADFIVLDRPLFEVPVTEIHRTTVEETWFHGARVH